MKLLEPGQIGTLTIKNRIIMAAMGIRGTCDAGSEEYWGERVQAAPAAGTGRPPGSRLRSLGGV